MRSKLFRAVVCLLLVCCLIVNISPIKAKAVEPISTGLGIGILALLILAAAGVIFLPTSEPQIEAVGQSFSNFLYDWSTESEEIQERVEEYFTSYSIYQPGDDESPDDNKIIIPAEFLPGIQKWLEGLIKGEEVVEMPGEEAPEGYAYYNGVLLPLLPNFSSDTKIYGYISYSSGKYTLQFCNTRPYSTDSVAVYMPKGTAYSAFVTLGDSWGVQNDYYLSSGGTGSLNVIWSNFDIVHESSGEVTFFASAPAASSSIVETFADSLVGDVAPGVQDGTLTADEITVPETIDYGDALQYQGLTGPSAMQQILEDMSTGTLTYEEYQTLIGVGASNMPEDGTATEPDSATEPDAATEPGTVVDPNTDPVTATGLKGWLESIPKAIADAIGNLFIPSQNLEYYAMDLTEFFPFCIPWDIYAFLQLFQAEPTAPHLEFDIEFPYMNEPWHLVIDLSDFDSVAQLARNLELVLFIVGLAIFTRERFLRG